MLQSPRVTAGAHQAFSPREAASSRLARRPSQRQMLEMAFEGQPISDDHDPELEFEAEVMLSPRANHIGSHGDGGYQDAYHAGHNSARSVDGSWHEQAAHRMMVPTTPSYALTQGVPAVTSDDDEDTAFVEGADPELFQAGVYEHAKRLGIDPEAERELLWIARESLVAQLPQGWTHATATETGEPYYYNFDTGESRWDHPCDDHFRRMVESVKRRQSMDGSQQYSSGGDMHTASFYEQHHGGYNTDGTGAMALAWQDEYEGSVGQHSSYSGSDYHPRTDHWTAPTSAAGNEGAHDYYQGYDDQLTATTATGSSSKGYEDQSDLDVAESHSTVISSGRQQFARGSGTNSPSLAEMQSLQTRLEELETKNKELEEQRGLNDALILKLEVQVKDLMAQIAEMEQQKEHVVPIAEKQALEANVKELRNALEGFEKEAKELREAHGTMQHELIALRQDQKESTAANGAVAPNSHFHEIEELKQAAAHEQSFREKLEAELAALQAQAAVISKDLSASRATVKKLEGDLSRKATKENEASKLAAASAATLASELAAAECRIESLTAELAERDAAVEARQSEVAAAHKEMESLKQQHVKAAQASNQALQDQLATQEAILEEVKRELALREAARQTAVEEKTVLSSKLEQQSKLTATQQADAEEQQRTLKRDIRALERELKALQSVSKEREDEFAAAKRVMLSMEQKLQEQDTVVATARRAGYEEAEKVAAETIRQIHADKARTAELYAQELQTRRKLHNRLMELQGNIRVFCRVRPIQAVELKSDQSAPAVFYRENDAESLDLVVGGELGPDGKLLGAGQKHQFEFDHVFQPSSSQEQVFEQTKALVTSALDGFNVCIFAYGQTGSGKTHTMEGSDADRGVNYRSLEELFKIREERQAAGNFECAMKLSILEVYNETVVDLLDNASPPASGLDQRKGLEIRLGKQGVYVENLIEVDVSNQKDVIDLMTLGKSHRSVGSHDFNEHSSRSHLVLSITIETVNKVENRRRVSKLHLIDLAGSERVSKTAASGQRLKEAQNINRSLSALGDVIAALGSNSKHVPYRNSKLTFLLQESLSGNSKVLMFVNVSPVQWNAWETLCSLNFASRCRNVALGLAKASTGSDTASGSSSSVSKEPSRGGIPPSSIKASGSGGPRSSAPSPSVKGATRMVYG